MKRALAFALLCACSIPDKVPGETDAAVDAPAIDAPVDAPAIDAPAIDAPAIDAPAIDASAPPVLEFDQATYTFPSPVRVDGGNAEIMLTLRNTGGSPATNIALSVLPTSGLFVFGCSGALAPSAMCTVTASFNPEAVGVNSFTVTATSMEGPADSATVNGTGSAVLSVAMNLVPFGGAPASGMVTSNPAGISCTSGTCMGTFTQTPVTLTATEPGDATLSDWGVVTCPVTTTCNVALVGDRAITTTFRTPMTYNDNPGTVDQAEGVALTADGSYIVLVGFRSNVGFVQRIVASSGALFDQNTFTGGATVRTFRDVSIAPNTDIGVSGEVTGNMYDARKGEILADLSMERSTYYTNADAGQDYGLGVCHDQSNNLYMVGQQTGLMFFGRWAPNTYNPTWLRTGISGTAFDVAWDFGTLWVAGTQGGSGWLGKLNANDGAQQTFINPSMTTAVYGVFPIGAADLFTVGANGTSVRVHRLTSGLGEVFARSYAAPGTVTGGAIVVEPTAGAVYVAATDSTTCQLYKLDGNTGNVIWSKAAFSGHCEDLAANSDGVVVAGWTGTGGNRNAIAKKYFH
jgi:hypothetical protein